MISLYPSKDPVVILSFMKGDGIRGRCLGGFEDPGNEAISQGIKESNCVFLVAKDGDTDQGFVMLKPESPGVWSIHLCLKTQGEKTRTIFAMVLNCAVNAGIVGIDASYPSSYRAVRKLLDEFGFKDKDPDMESTPVPYDFKRLNLI